MYTGMSVFGLFVVLALAGGVVTSIVVIIGIISRRSGWRNDPDLIACSKCDGPVNIASNACPKCGTLLND